MAHDRVADSIKTLRFAYTSALGLFDDIPADKRLYQPTPNANHALWNLGHLAISAAGLMKMAGGPVVEYPAKWEECFNFGTTPTAAGDYPRADELRDLYVRAHETLAAWFDGLSEKELDAPLPEQLKDFAERRSQLAPGCAWHVGFHAGQLATIRKALGKPPLMI